MVTALIAVWCTLLAVAPPRRPLVLGVVAYLCGWVVSELPFAAFCYVLVSTLLAPAGQRDLAACLAAVTTAGLVLIAWRGLRAGPAVNRALDEGLGTGWRSGLDPSLAVGLRSRLPWARIVFAPFFYRRRDVERIANISYGDAGRKNLLDLYRHRDQPPGGPILVHLHGGALFMGKKNREARPLLYRLASQGWVCISANYRLRPAAQFPDYLIDVKKVIAWAREHARAHGADPALVFVAGSSSGAQLAALAAFTPNDPAYQPGFERADTSVSAAICLQGYYGQPGDQSPSTPLAYRGTDAPPFFVAHGDRDSVAPAATARLFATRLRAASSNPVVYAELPGGQHGFDRFHSLRFDRVVEGVEGFAAWVRSRQPARRLLTPAVVGPQDAQGVYGEEAPPLPLGGRRPGQPVERPAAVVALGLGQMVQVRLDRRLVEQLAGQRIGLGREVQRRVHLTRCLRVERHQVPLDDQRADPAEHLPGLVPVRHVLQEPEHAEHVVRAQVAYLGEPAPHRLGRAVQPRVADAARV